jgi:molybdenum-dependent DNA-binding transcriptional regulator ModE
MKQLTSEKIIEMLEKEKGNIILAAESMNMSYYVLADMIRELNLIDKLNDIRNNNPKYKKNRL